MDTGTRIDVPSWPMVPLVAVSLPLTASRVCALLPRAALSASALQARSTSFAMPARGATPPRPSRRRSVDVAGDRVALGHQGRLLGAGALDGGGQVAQLRASALALPPNSAITTPRVFPAKGNR